MTRTQLPADQTTWNGRFGSRLTALREKAGLSVEEFAAALGKKKGIVYAWEKGKNFPSILLVPKISEVLKLKKIRDLFPNE